LEILLLIIERWNIKGENPLKCTTHDEKGLVFTRVHFYFIFWSPKNKKNQKLLKISDYILNHYKSRFHYNHP